MKRPSRKQLLALGAMLLLALVVWSPFRARSVPPQLAVGLVAVKNNPGSHPWEMAMVLNGNTGLCAVFAVTNVGKDASAWFNTCALEQKVGTEWRRTALASYRLRVVDQLRAGRKPWYAVDSEDVNDVCPPGKAWYYAVAWPPDVPTNATWRLQLSYGRAPTAFTAKIVDAFGFTGKLGISFSNKRRAERTLLTPAVRQ